MKFGRYLQENLTPEWRRAYIDYRGCKKRIKAVSTRLNNTARSGSTTSSPTPLSNNGHEVGGQIEGEASDGYDGSSKNDSGTKAGSVREAVDPTSRAAGTADDGGNAERRSRTDPGANSSNQPRGTQAKSPRLSAQLSPKLKSKWRAAIGDDADSSDDDLDHGHSAPPLSVRSRNTPSIRASSTRTPRTPLSATAAAPNSRRLDPQTHANSATMSPRSIHSPPGGPTRRPKQPPFLDLGEPSVQDITSAQTSATRARGNTVAFVSSPTSEDGEQVHLATPRIIQGSDPHIGRSPEESASDHSHDRGHSQDNNGHDQDFDAATPLTGPVPADTAVSPERAAVDTKARLGMRMPGSPKSPIAAFQALVRRASRATASPNDVTGSSSSTQVQAARPSSRSLRSFTLPSPTLQPRTASSFDELYEHLEPDEKAFFDFLDSELQKVESFYLARQAEAVKRGHELQAQLKELAEHRRIYHQLYGDNSTGWEGKVERILPTVIGNDATQATVSGVQNAAQKLHLRLPGRAFGLGSGQQPATSPPVSDAANHEHGPTPGITDDTLNQTAKLREAMMSDKEHKTYSPERYTKYKAELKKAVLEYYRSLEILKNYRIMNVTGFRKALKKFEKATRIHCLEMYTDERISFEAFATGQTIEQLLKTAEDMFSTHFEHGDIKKARDRLRKQDSGHTHYTSIFRSGLMIGVSLPIAIVTLVQAVKNETHQVIPAWDGLLQVYGDLFLPVLFALLFELNLAAYVANRINYSFVMELSRPVLDFRSYLEIPSFLFLTLSVCMYFSFHRIGAENVDPTSWPAGWLVFVAVFFLNPLPIFRRHTRYWFLRVLWRVITPGWSRVEFIAFVVADELNSLVYSISNIMFLSCAYANRWPDDLYSVCPSGSRPQYIAMFCIPPLIRLIQCVKRWHDSRLKIHLINAGKYCSSIAQYSFFVWWRSRGSRIPDNVFIGWVIVAVIQSTYNVTWDFMVDWALFKPGSRNLRPERGYPSKYIYYFAVITNLLIRFVWIWYIPARASHVRLRSFFFAMAEMLRRWQWNFFRVETEHLGNADAYRVTREIPLPYRNLEPDSDEEAEIKSKKSGNPIKARWKAVLHRLRDGSGHEDEPGGHTHDHGHVRGLGHHHNGSGPDDGGDGVEQGGEPIRRNETRAYEARHPDDEIVRHTSPIGRVREGDRGDKWVGLVARLKNKKGSESLGQG